MWRSTSRLGPGGRRGPRRGRDLSGPRRRAAARRTTRCGRTARRWTSTRPACSTRRLRARSGTSAGRTRSPISTCPGRSTVRITSQAVAARHRDSAAVGRAYDRRWRTTTRCVLTLDGPRKFSVEPDGKKGPLLLFANPLETDPPKPGDAERRLLRPRRPQAGEDLRRRATRPCTWPAARS